MKITVNGKLSADDKKTIKHFASWALNSHFGLFCWKPAIKSTVVINFVSPSSLKGEEKKDLIEFHGWMEQNTKSKYTLTISTSMRSMKDKLLCIGHELVHVKQYLHDEMEDLPNNFVRFKGQYYKYFDYGEGYWFSPWEIEAYGMELGLYDCFIKQPK